MNLARKSQPSFYTNYNTDLQFPCKLPAYMAIEPLSDLIQRRLRDLNMSKSELAEKIGRTRAYVGTLANGTAANRSGQTIPSPDVVEKLAIHLKVSRDQILTAIGYPPENLPDPRLEGVFVAFHNLQPDKQDQAIEDLLLVLDIFRAKQEKEKNQQ
jgi:transcriptional regulator with XRE-family HTH domain